jgi:intracellular sulfur oxidation DsrE/DsrF family protein
MMTAFPVVHVKLNAPVKQLVKVMANLLSTPTNVQIVVVVLTFVP